MRQTARAIVSSLCLAAVTASADEVRIGAEHRQSIDVTIYGNGLALIRDRREVQVPAGPSRLALASVSPEMEPSSVRIAADGITVAAVDYDFDVMTAEALLRRALGSDVGVVRTHPTTGEETVERATVLSVAGGPVLRYRDRIETGVPGRLVFEAVPDDLRAEPTLVASVSADTAGAKALDVHYLTSGLSWSADYAVIVDDASETVAVEGRATVANGSGLEIVDATVALIAGDVRRVSAERPPNLRAEMAASDGAMVAATAPPVPEREAFSDLHLYRVAGTVSLGDRQTRQITLLGATDVPFEARYISEENAQAHYVRRFAGEPRPSHPDVHVTFRNDPDTGVGAPMPAGLVRVYGRDTGGAIRLVGEARIDHTPVGEAVDVVPSSAFDITVLREQLSLERSGLRDRVSESSHRVTVKNGRDEAVAVRIVETLPGDWRILAETIPHEKPLAHRAEWLVPVPAGGETVLEYRVRVES